MVFNKLFYRTMLYLVVVGQYKTDNSLRMYCYLLFLNFNKYMFINHKLISIKNYILS